MLGENAEYGLIGEMNEESIYENIKMLLDDKKLLEHYKNQAKVRGKEFSKENTLRVVEKMIK